MKYRLLKWLACPSCGEPDLTLETVRTETVATTRGHFDEGEGQPPGVDFDARSETEVLEGALHCGGCASVYPIREGVPRMLPKGSEAGPPTAHQRWTTFDSAVPEWEADFLEFAQPMGQMDFLGKVVLDAGCGFGRHAFFAGRYGAEVVAIDSSPEAVSACWANTRGLARVHVVQGDITRPPVRESAFDLAYCFGVLHHIDAPREAFDRIGQALRPGGRLALWVYGPRQGATLAVNNALRGMTTGMEPEELHRFSRAVASGLRLFSHTPYRILGKVPVAGTVVSHLPVHDHHKWPYEVVVADIYDRLRVPVKHWFKGEELERWLSDAGYADVQVNRRVRNNETFRATGLRR